MNIKQLLNKWYDDTEDVMTSFNSKEQFLDAREIIVDFAKDAADLEIIFKPNETIVYHGKICLTIYGPNVSIPSRGKRAQYYSLDEFTYEPDDIAGNNYIPKPTSF